MRRIQVMRRAARRPLATDEAETAETATGPAPHSALPRRRAVRDADVAGTMSRIDEVTAS